MKGSYIAITSSIVAASGGLLFGYDIGELAVCQYMYNSLS